MAQYILRRLLWLFPVLIGISLITFVIMHLVPGGPWDREKQLAPAVVQNLNRKYGLDDPLWKQYLHLVANAIRGDLGVSYIYQDRSVTSIILQGLPKTATIGLLAFAIALGIGIPLGMAAAIKHNSWIDYLCVEFATIFASIPGFVLAFILIIIFSVTFHLLPTGGWGRPQNLVLPAFALAALPAAYIARISRASMLEVLGQDYIRTAHAKGLPQLVIYYRHALKNALIPVLTIAGPELGALITGSFIIEQVFAIPGVGRLFVQGVFQRDYGLIMGAVLFYAAIIALLNLVVDVLYSMVDPRIRYN
ncbi:MAG: ABC transporter permease [Dehalococcoidia bacterium]|nr:ABC transporter permease [Dehalococcoidia bacterium]